MTQREITAAADTFAVHNIGCTVQTAFLAGAAFVLDQQKADFLKEYAEGVKAFIENGLNTK